ncbi:MAG: hypothetical protein V4691_01645 [Pseudomonadota bacterium]
MLKRLLKQFQQQVENFEKCDANDDLERSTKSLAALTSTLERLSNLDEEMAKKKLLGKNRAAKNTERSAILRKLVKRFAELTRKGQPRNAPAANTGNVKRRGA